MAHRIVCLLACVVVWHSPFIAAQAQPQSTPTPEQKTEQNPQSIGPNDNAYKSVFKTSPPIPTGISRADQNLSDTRRMNGDVEITSDTRGVDFGPYLQRALYRIKMNWYNLIPSVAKPPTMKSGRVIIAFAIMKDGRVRGMVPQLPSGDVSLDRAAWGGILASDPFDALPAEFSGNYLGLRIKFVYNQKGEKETVTVPPSFQIPSRPFQLPSNPFQIHPIPRYHPIRSIILLLCLLGRGIPRLKWARVLRRRIQNRRPPLNRKRPQLLLRKKPKTLWRNRNDCSATSALRPSLLPLHLWAAAIG
jgi:hypothetical protein